MLTPTTALAWELWQKHRERLLIIFGALLGFALFYQKLCALAGLNLAAEDISDAFVKRLALVDHSGPVSPLTIARILYVLLLGCAPAVAMLLSLLYATWMFTFTGVEAETKDPMKFPGRLFTLPVSTSFLFLRLTGGGLAGIALLHAAWSCLVPQPRMANFDAFDNCFLWLTLLILTQGITWALAGWPGTRTFVLVVLLWGLMAAPAWAKNPNWQLALFPLFLVGALLAWSGLEKMRHDEWRAWPWAWPMSMFAGDADLRGPKRFASAARAQLWFEWRRLSHALCLTVAALVLVPVVIPLLVRALWRPDPIQTGTLSLISGFAVGMPIVVYLLAGISPGGSDLPFLLNRPLTNGQIVMARLKATMISVLVSWVAVVVALVSLPLLGDFEAVEQNVSAHPLCRAAVVLGMAFLSWRLVAANLCFVLTGSKRLTGMPVLLLIGTYAGIFTVVCLSTNPEYWGVFLQNLPWLLGALIALKFLLATVAFGASLKRRLIAASTVAAYVGVWTLLVGAGLMVLAGLRHLYPEMNPPAWQISLLVILLVPLARIGFCPIALSWNRHT
jgi:hypothetical protein